MADQQNPRAFRKTVPSFRLRAPLVAALCACGAGPSFAASLAFDSAADPTYNTQPDGSTGWVLGSNGGFGWGGGWLPNGPGPAGSPIFPLGSSATNGGGDQDGDGGINTPRNAGGRAWPLAASQGFDGLPAGQSNAVFRKFNGQLSVGQTFRIDFDNGSLADPTLSDGTKHPGTVGWFLFGPDPTREKFGFEAIAGQPNYWVFEGIVGLRESNIPVTTEGLHCEFTLLPATLPFPDGWTMKITPLFPGAPTYTVTGAREGQPIDRLFLADTGGGLDPSEFVYFNNISVGNVPEPGSAGIVALAAAALLRRRRT